MDSYANKLNKRNSFLLLTLKPNDEGASDLTTRYAEFCRAVAAHLWSVGFRNIIIELGNEPDNGIENAGTQYFEPRGVYANLANAAAAAIKSVSEFPISTGGICQPMRPDNSFIHDQWVKEMIDDINWNNIEFLGYHAYAPSHDARPEVIESYSLDACIDYMRDLLDLYAPGLKRDVLMTERGWPAGLSDQTRTAYYTRMGLLHIRKAVEGAVWFIIEDRPMGTGQVPLAAQEAAMAIQSAFEDNPKHWMGVTGTAQYVGVNPTGVTCETVGRKLWADGTRQELHVAIWRPVDGVGDTQYATVEITPGSGYVCATYVSLADPTTIRVLPISGNRIYNVPISGMPIILTLRQTRYWADLADGINSYIYPDKTQTHTMESGQTQAFQVDLKNVACATWDGVGGADPVMIRIRDDAEPQGYFRAPDWLPIDLAGGIAAAGYVNGPVPTGAVTRLTWSMKAPDVTVTTTYHVSLSLYSRSGECRVNGLAEWDITVTPVERLPDYDLTSMSALGGERRPGESFYVGWTVQNIGGDAAASSQTSVYLSADSAWTEDDILVADSSQAALSAGQAQSAYVNGTVPLGTPPGVYHIFVVADRTNAIAESDESNNTIYGWIVTVLPAAPAADFAASPRSGPAPLGVQFTDLSTGNPTSWSWDFGDGGTSTARNPSHTYAGPGAYTVSLTATNSGGSDLETKSNYIAVSAPPVSDFIGTPTSGQAPLTVTFTDTSTNGPTSWSWDFGDGSTSTVQSPSHTYASAGIYTVNLTATNTAGSDTETKSGYVLVNPPPPVADFTGTPTSGVAPLTVTFTDTSTNSPTSWSWTFGDGGTSTVQNPSHVYTSPGTYTVGLTVVNAGGVDTETKVGYIAVSPVANLLSFTGSHGKVSVDGGSLQSLPCEVEVSSGSTPLLLAEADSGYGFVRWEIGAFTSATNPLQLWTIADDTAITVVFEPTSATDHTLILSGEHGRIAVNGIGHDLPWSGSFAHGTQLTLLAAADAGYIFDSWSGGIPMTTGNPIAVTLDGDTSIACTFRSTPDFADVPSTHWAYDEIEWCYVHGIVQGFPDGNYQPLVNVTRDQMAAYISRALAGGDANVPAFTGTPTFPDVDSTHWALKYVEYAVDQGVVGGYDDGLYHPEYDEDRGQMAVFIARALVAPLGEAGLADYVPSAPRNFPDVPSDFWAWKHIEYCVENGVVNGYGDGTYHPEYVVTRDQMAVYTARAMNAPQEVQVSAQIEGPPAGNLAAGLVLRGVGSRLPQPTVFAVESHRVKELR
ncbi:MAG: PKD domain-containing protein [Armatimonadota bacterium]